MCERSECFCGQRTQRGHPESLPMVLSGLSNSRGLLIAGGFGLRGLEGPHMLTGSEHTCGVGLKYRQCRGGGVR